MQPITIIVPLAGPDFYTARLGIRPLVRAGTTTVLERVLFGRPWMQGLDKSGYQLVFVLREVRSQTEIFRGFLADRFPFADICTLSSLTEGACLSAIAGVSLTRRFDCPLVIDLADIGFATNFDPVAFFRNPTNRAVSAVVPYFESDDPKYSYLRMDGKNVIEAREKVVISRNASAGVYMFRDAAFYLDAVAYCLRNPAACRSGAALFVCPAVNGLIASGTAVEGLPVDNVEPISRLFH